MRKYVVKGTDLNKIIENVSKHFGVDINQIKHEIIRKSPELEVKVWIDKDSEDSLEKIPYFIDIREDGIFLKVEEVDENKSLTLKRVFKFLEEKHIKDFDIDKIDESIFNINKFVKIAEYDAEYYQDSEVIIESLNNMEATIKITKPNKGREASYEKVLKLVEEKGIVYGVRKNAIKTVLNDKIFDRKFILAKGKEPIDGIDAKINYTFEDNSVDEIGEDSIKSINFKELNLIHNVAEDGIIAEKIPPIDGTDGIDIYGRPVTAKLAKDIELKAGKNTYVTDDGLYLKSKISGQLIQKGKALNVEPLLSIEGDVDYSTGNVDFLGTVVIKGNVVSGFSVKSGEDIYVEGLVEDCDLHAEGKIIVNNGILGNEDCPRNIYAKEGVKAQFIQHMNIQTGGNVEVSKHILHSTIESGDKVIVTSGSGKIVGGDIKAQNGIECNIAGGPLETPTKFTLDIYSEYIKLESEINKDMLQLEENRYKMEKVVNELEPRMNELPDELKLKVDEAIHELMNINNKFLALQTEREYIEDMRQEIKTKKIRVLQKVYPGVIIKIGRELYLNRGEKIRTDFFINPETNEITER